MAKKRGFTVIEAVVAAILTGVGVVASLQAISSLTRSDAIMIDREQMLRLAQEKYDEIVATQDFSTAAGDFSDRGITDYSWQMTTSPITLPSNANITSTTSTSTSAAAATATSQNLDTLSVTVSPSNSSDTSNQQTISGLVFIPPQSTTVAAPGAGTGGAGAGGSGRPGGGTAGGTTGGGRPGG